MKRAMDDIDDRIVAELERNGRIAHAELASKVNLSRNAVRQRIERLERDGIICGYTIVRARAPREQRIAAILFVYRHDRMRGADVISRIRSFPEVVSCDIVTGEFDLVVRVEATEADRIRALWDSISALDGVRDTTTAFVLSSLIQRTAR